MAVYYRTDGNNVYFCNAAKTSDYTEWHANDIVAQGKYVNFERADPLTINEKFVFPEDCSYMCYGALNDGFSIYKVDSSHIKNMTKMFSGCSNLIWNPISRWDLSQVTNFTETFRNCISLVSPAFDTITLTGAAKNLNGMFYGCYSLKTFYAFNHTSDFKPVDLGCMFGDCAALETIAGHGIADWDMSEISMLNSMFRNCQSLTKLDISGGDLTKSTAQYLNTANMFYDCVNLERIKVKHVTDWSLLPNRITSSAMFTNCTKLPNFDSTKVNAEKANDRSTGYFAPAFEDIDVWIGSEEGVDSESTTIRLGPVHMANEPKGPFYRRYYRSSEKDGFLGFGCDIIIEPTNGKFMLPQDSKRMFFLANNISNLHIVDTSMCENYTYMFFGIDANIGGQERYTTLDLSTWTDFGRATTMDWMFSRFNGVGVVVAPNTDGKLLVPDTCDTTEMFYPFGGEERPDTPWPNFDINQIDINKANNIDGYFTTVMPYDKCTVMEKRDGEGQAIDTVLLKAEGNWNTTEVYNKRMS